MGKARSRPVTPDQRARDLRKEFQGFEREEPGEDRAVRLARFTRAATAERQLNMAMQTAGLCLQDDPAAPEQLLQAFDDPAEGAETQLDALVDLRDLARYIDQPSLVQEIDGRLRERARTWVTDGDDGERRYRLRTVQSLTSRELADEIRDELAAEA